MLRVNGAGHWFGFFFSSECLRMQWSLTFDDDSVSTM